TSGARPKPGSQPCQARATAENSCPATSPERQTSPARQRPAVPTAQRRTREDASPPQPRPQAPAPERPGQATGSRPGGYTRGLPRRALAPLRDRRKPAEQTWRAPTGPGMTALRLGFATFVTGPTACRFSRISDVYLIAALCR